MNLCKNDSNSLMYSEIVLLDGAKTTIIHDEDHHSVGHKHLSSERRGGGEPSL